MPKIHDESSHKYFSQVPNIIYEIGLSAYEIAIYGAIKKCAGENGSCTKSYKKLAISAGVSLPTLKRFLPKLSQKNKTLKKPLIRIKGRITECGDQDTNEITLVDIWMDNIMFFQKINGGVCENPPQLHENPPQFHKNPGVGSVRPEGGVCESYKEEPFKKNPYKKTTTSPPSKKKADDDDVFHKQKIKAMKEAALSLKAWVDTQADLVRRKKIHQGHYDDYSWGLSWKIPLVTYEFLIDTYGLDYFQDQLTHMVKCQEEFDKGTSKKPIEKPETVLKLGCKHNYAGSIHKTKDEK